MGSDVDVIKEVFRIGSRIGIDEAIEIYTAKVVVREAIYWRKRYSQDYNSNWCTLPNTPKPEETKRLLKEYKKAVLVMGHSDTIEKEVFKDISYFNGNKNRIKKKTINSKNEFRKAIIKIEKQLRKKGLYRAMALLSHPCSLCEPCFYPKECPKPKFRRPQIESMGVDIKGTMRNVKKGWSFPEKKEVFYSIILLE